jgi:hypothetical protein
MRGIAGAGPVKITSGEIWQFLSFLPMEVRSALRLSATEDDGRQSNQYAIKENKESQSNPPDEVAWLI